MSNLDRFLMSLHLGGAATAGASLFVLGVVGLYSLAGMYCIIPVVFCAILSAMFYKAIGA